MLQTAPLGDEVSGVSVKRPFYRRCTRRRHRHTGRQQPRDQHGSQPLAALPRPVADPD